MRSIALLLTIIGLLASVWAFGFAPPPTIHRVVHRHADGTLTRTLDPRAEAYRIFITRVRYAALGAIIVGLTLHCIGTIIRGGHSPLFAEVCAASTLVLLLLFVLFALHARVGIGHWPRFPESYNTPLFRLHGFATAGAFFFALAAPVLWGIAHCFRSLRPPSGARGRHIATYFGGGFASWFIFAADLFGFTSFLLE